MSDIAMPDVTGDGLRPSVMDGLSGGDFGEEKDADPSLSISALLAQQGEDEPGDQAAAPDEGTTDAENPDNSDAGNGDEQTDWKKQYEELRALTGRMSNELGELRKAVESKDEPDDEEDDSGFVLPTFVPDEVRDEIEVFIEQQGGANAAAWAAVNRPDLFDTVLDVWADQGGAAARHAAEFNIRYQDALKEQTQTQTQKSEAEFAKSLEADLDSKVKEMAPDYGFEVGNKEHDTLLATVLGESPEAIQSLVVSKDPAQREAGLRAVFAMAVVKAGVTTPEADGAAQEALAVAKAVSKGAASVGGGGLRPATSAAPASQEQAIEQAVAARLLQMPSTSVSEGLTGGGFSR